MLRTVLRATLGWILGLFFRRIDVSGTNRVPPRGPVIFAINHPNGLVDPLLLLTFVPRPVSFLAKAPLIGGAVRENIGCVRHDHPLAPGGREVDQVYPHAEVGDHPNPAPARGENRLREPICHGRDQAVVLGAELNQLLGRQIPVVGIPVDREPARQASLRLGREPVESIKSGEYAR